MHKSKVQSIVNKFKVRGHAAQSQARPKKPYKFVRNSITAFPHAKAKLFEEEQRYTQTHVVAVHYMSN